MMRRFIFLFFLLCHAGLSVAADHPSGAQPVATPAERGMQEVSVRPPLERTSAIANRLVDDGFENVRVVRGGRHVKVALEDNHYRGIFRGLACALLLISPSPQADDTITLVALRDRMPRLTVHAVHRDGQWAVDVSHGGQLSPALRRCAPWAPSTWKVDVIPYPHLTLSNDTYDRLWSYAFYLSPAVEMTLWPGAHLTAQVRIPVSDNFDEGDFHSVVPGYVTLGQQLLATERWDVRATGGIFNEQRFGLDTRASYHVTPGLDVGLIAGYTGPWYDTHDQGVRFGRWDKVHCLARVNYYDRRSRLQVDLKGGRFVRDDWGGSLDVLRHYRDYAFGLYGELTELGSNVGIEFNFPICPKRMGRRRAVRVRMPQAWGTRINANSDPKVGHNESQIAVLPRVSTAQEYTADYWQPQHIRQCIMLILDGKLEVPRDVADCVASASSPASGSGVR